MVNKLKKSQEYKDEFDFIFNKKGSGVRRATVISALIEWQVISLAKKFLEEKAVIHKPETYQAYNQSFNVLKTNKIIDLNLINQLIKFREERNKSIHRIFDMERKKWNKQNALVVEIGKPIIKELDKKLEFINDDTKTSN